ncbi:ATP-binding protein [Streptomyces sp. NPDC002573]|uniref:ATP-binding protein n=1 Tax=Streptomyces sp. NPDC002573 TaxID=3364651 RepID=UPI0036AF6438
MDIPAPRRRPRERHDQTHCNRIARLHRTLPCEPETARRARRLVSAALNTWGIGELADAGTLIVYELVSNAIRRTSCRLVRVSVQRVTNDLVRIGVTDKSHALPKMDRVAGGDEPGRGLVLVEALSHRWGYDEMRSGKTVWAELVVSAC